MSAPEDGMNDMSEMTIEIALKRLKGDMVLIRDAMDALNEGNITLDHFIFDTDRVIGWMKENLQMLSELADAQSDMHDAREEHGRL